MTKKQTILTSLGAAGMAAIGILGVTKDTQAPEARPPAQERPADQQDQQATTTEEMSWDEWQAYADVLDHEIKKNNGIQMRGAKMDDILPEIERVAKNRTEIKDVDIDGENYSKDEYKKLKDGLLEKARRVEIKNGK